MLLNQLPSGDLTVASLKIKINGGDRSVILASGFMPSEREALPPSEEAINLATHTRL